MQPDEKAEETEKERVIVLSKQRALPELQASHVPSGRGWGWGLITNRHGVASISNPTHYPTPGLTARGSPGLNMLASS